MRTDASLIGYGGVHYQVNMTAAGKRKYESLKLMPHKFSDAATHCDTISQECFSIFACTKECEHLLRGKPFIIETDHANLQWMEEASRMPKIIRQHLYLHTLACCFTTLLDNPTWLITNPI